MWVTVKNKFADKYTGKIYMPGDKLNLKKDRIEEILSVSKDLIEYPKNGKETSK